MLVVKEGIRKSDLTKSKDKLESMLNIKWIDLSQKTEDKLKKLKPSIFNYDLKFGSKAIWGDKEIFDIMPNFTPEQLNLREAEILFFTRLYTFLGSLDKDGFEQGVDGEAARFFRNQMAKATLAIVDILLLQKAAFHTSYRKRVLIFKELYSDRLELVKLAEWAVEEKINPKAPKMSKEEVTDLYQPILTNYLSEVKIALSKLYGTNIRNIDDLRKAKKYSFNEIVVQLKSLILARTLSPYRKGMAMKFAQAYIAEAYLSNDEDAHKKLLKAAGLINKLGKSTPTIDWNELRLLSIPK